MPSVALKNYGAFKQEFTEIKMREILNMALPNSYCKKLFGIDWNIYEQSFLKTVNKIQSKIKADKTKSMVIKVPSATITAQQKCPTPRKRRLKLVVNNTRMYDGKVTVGLLNITNKMVPKSSTRSKWNSSTRCSNLILPIQNKSLIPIPRHWLQVGRKALTHFNRCTSLNNTK